MKETGREDYEELKTARKRRNESFCMNSLNSDRNHEKMKEDMKKKTEKLENLNLYIGVILPPLILNYNLKDQNKTKMMILKIHKNFLGMM
jgi:hypothetical protein